MSTRIYTSRDLVKATGESLGISFRGSNWCTQEESDDRQAVLLRFPCFARSVLFHLGSLFVVPDLQMSDPFLMSSNFLQFKIWSSRLFRTKSNLSFVKQNRPELFKGQGQQVQETARALHQLLQAWQVSLAFAAPGDSCVRSIWLQALGKGLVLCMRQVDIVYFTGALCNALNLMHPQHVL